MHRLSALCLLLFISLACAQAETNAPKPDAAKDATFELLYFTASWCGPCQMMKTRTWPDPRVKAVLHPLIFRTVDIDQEPGFSQQWGVRSVPTLILREPAGSTELARTAGYKEPEQFVVWLKDATDAAREAIARQRAAEAALAELAEPVEKLIRGETVSAPDTVAAQSVLFSLLADRNAPDEAAVLVDHWLSQLAATRPEMLQTGLSHPDLMVRIRIARALESTVADPWLPPQS